MEERWIWDDERPEDRKLVDITVECTNYGLTYTAEDMKAINEGRKKLEDCWAMVKEYPVPVITVDEDLKRKYIDAYNSAREKWTVRPICIYERSDAELLKKRQEAEYQDPRQYLRRPGEDRASGASTSGSMSSKSTDLPRRFLKRPTPRAAEKPALPSLPPTEAQESKVKDTRASRTRTQS